MSDNQNKQRSQSDAELEREICQERKFSLAEAIGRMAGPGAIKGESPIPRLQQAVAEIQERPWPNDPHSAGVMRVVARKERLQEFHGVHEFAFPDSHGEVDQVEVRFAVEATTQVGAGIDGGAVLLAARTEEGDLSAPQLVRPGEALKEVGHRDLIAPLAE